MPCTLSPTNTSTPCLGKVIRHQSFAVSLTEDQKYALLWIAVCLEIIHDWHAKERRMIGGAVSILPQDLGHTELYEIHAVALSLLLYGLSSF